MKIIACILGVLTLIAVVISLMLLSFGFETRDKGWEGYPIMWLACGFFAVVAVVLGAITALLWILPGKAKTPIDIEK